MCKLYVFGNGFDLCHGFNTKYSDFRDWLKNKIKKQPKRIYGVPDYSTNYRHAESYSKNDFINYFFPLIDDACKKISCEDWSDFEKALGEIEWSNILVDADYIYDEEGELDPFNAGNNIEDMANNIFGSCHILNQLFEEWISEVEEHIDKSHLKSEFKNLDNGAIYLSFNYTSTLESIYDIKKVNHIHGYIKDFDELIVGHGKDDFDDSYFRRNDLAMNAETYIRNTFEHFRKQTEKIISKNNGFFCDLKNVDEIYIFGCSLNSIDRTYFKKIFDNVLPSSKVYLNVYNKQEYPGKVKYIKKLGNNNIEPWL